MSSAASSASFSICASSRAASRRARPKSDSPTTATSISFRPRAISYISRSSTQYHRYYATTPTTIATLEPSDFKGERNADSADCPATQFRQRSRPPTHRRRALRKYQAVCFFCGQCGLSSGRRPIEIRPSLTLGGHQWRLVYSCRASCSSSPLSAQCDASHCLEGPGLRRFVDGRRRDLGPFLRLHRLCARPRFDSAYGSPPALTGTRWSTCGPSGWVPGRVLSTGFPHR